jgi:hypothetical protein
MMLFLLGCVVTILTVTALALVGLSEAADPDHSRKEDLTEWEWSLVRRERAKLAADRATAHRSEVLAAADER